MSRVNRPKPGPDGLAVLVSEVAKIARDNSEHQAAMTVTLEKLSEQKPPVVTVNVPAQVAPVVNVPPSEVRVSTPITVEAQKGGLSMSVKVTKRDQNGNIEEAQISVTRT